MLIDARFTFTETFTEIDCQLILAENKEDGGGCTRLVDKRLTKMHKARHSVSVSVGGKPRAEAEGEALDLARNRNRMYCEGGGACWDWFGG